MVESVETPVLARVRELVTPIATDLDTLARPRHIVLRGRVVA